MLKNRNYAFPKRHPNKILQKKTNYCYKRTYIMFLLLKPLYLGCDFH